MGVRQIAPVEGLFRKEGEAWTLAASREGIDNHWRPLSSITAH